MVKTPIVILHGWQVPVDRYQPLKKAFINKGFDVFLPALPGFEKNNLSSKVYSLSDYLKFVIDFLNKKKTDRIFLIGHSFGGRVAIKLAALQPEKIRALILSGVPAIRNNRLKRLSFLLAAKIGSALFALLPFRFFRKEARKTLYRLIGNWDYYQAKGVKRETFRKIVAEDLESLLSEIKTPTFLIWGENDKTVPVLVAKKMVKKIPRARLAVVSGTSHQLPYEKPQIFLRECLKFFSSPKI